jgi:hypothetical protein
LLQLISDVKFINKAFSAAAFISATDPIDQVVADSHGGIGGSD